ncbi:MAG: hypothetical protein ACRBN8_45910 [Nannocystales bacterium]
MDRGAYKHQVGYFGALLGVMLIAGCDGATAPGGDDGSGGIDTIGSATATDGGTDGGTDASSDTIDSDSMGSDTQSSDSDTTTGGSTDTDDSDTADTGTTDDTNASDTDNEPTLLFLEVTPPETILELDLNSGSSVDFIVTANYSDGSSIDVTGDATWDVSNAAVGAMNGATLEIPGFADSFFESAILTADVAGETGQAQVTIAAYDLANDFFFVLPFEDKDGPQDQPLTFNTDVKSMDVFINMDTTGSMAGEINNLRSALASDVIPAILAEVPNTQFGAGSFDDFPISPYGTAGTDQPFVLLQEITNNVALVQTAVNTYSAAGGNDGPESGVEALYQIATGDGLVGPAPTSVAANNSGIGGVGFREGSLPIVVSITDNVTHDTDVATCGRQYSGAVAAAAHSQTEAMDAMNNICGRVIQIAIGGTGSCTAYEDGLAFNNATDARVPTEAWDVVGRPPGCAAGQCCTGQNGTGRAADGEGLCPMTFTADASGNGVGDSFASAVPLLAAYGRFDVTSAVTGGGTDVDGVALPMGTTTADFIQAVTPFDHGVVPLPGVPDPTLTPTTFENVVPDTDVIFTVTAFNDFVEQGPDARLFTANIQVLADDCGDLDDRDVFILVPPEALPAPG